MKLTYASAADWASRDPEPDPSEIEAYSAQRDLDIVSTMMGYSTEADAQRMRRGKRGFVYILEEWILPAIGGAALIFGVIMLSPSTIFGDSVGWITGSGSNFDIDTVSYSNLDGRIMTAIITSLIAFVLLAANVITHLSSKNIRGESTAAALIMMIASGVGLVYIWLLGNEGFSGFTMPVLTYAGIIAAGIVTFIVYYSQGGHRRDREEFEVERDPERAERKHAVQRFVEAEAQFAQLPTGRQQEILADRAQAVQVLTQRGVLHPQIQQDLPHLRFGELTAALTTSRAKNSGT